MATFYNQATLSYTGGSISSNVTVGEINESLSVTKTAVVSEYSRNSDITYAVNIVNSGNTDFHGLSISDNLGAYAFGDTTLYPLDYVDGSVRYFINGILQDQPDVVPGPPLVISDISIPAGGNTTILYTTRTNNFAQLDIGSIIENTVTVCGCGIECLTADETISVSNSLDLRILKTLSPTTINRGGRLTYTFVIQNYGNTGSDTNENIILTDTFLPVLADLEVSYNGVLLILNEDYNYNTSTGLFNTVEGKITVPAASYEQNETTGEWTAIPGTATLVVTGTIN